MAVLACTGGTRSDEELATVEAVASIDPVQSTADAAATQAVQAEALALTQEFLGTAQALAATATAYSPILAELPKYGVDPNEGQPGWIHPPLSISVEGFSQTDFANDFLPLVLADFVVSSDITMTTDTGLAGCGFIFRSDGDEESPSQYIGLITRGGGGSIGFIEQIDGFNNNPNVPTVQGIDPNFEDANGATNRLTLVARGSEVTFYTNDVRIQSFPATQFSEGFLAMAAISESGTTSCQFNNTWMYVIGELPQGIPGQ